MAFQQDKGKPSAGAHFDAMVKTVEAEREARKTPEERSKDIVRDIRMAFQLGSHDSGRAAIDEAVKEWSVRDFENHVRAKITATTEATNALKEIVMKGKYDTLSVDEKVAFHEALRKGNGATGYPMETDIAGAQGRWENATEDLQHAAESRMRARDALSGRTKIFDEKSVSSHEALRLRKYVQQAEALIPSDKSQIVAELQKAVDELIGAKGDMEALAKTKRYAPGEKGRRIEEFKADVARAHKAFEDFYALRERLNDYGHTT